MRAVIQRVLRAKVEVGADTIGRIDGGLLVYLSVGTGDTDSDARWMADKIANLRIFADANDKMNLSIGDVDGAVLLISQFTLHGDCRKGRRPGFDQAAEPTVAERLYELTAELLEARDISVETGAFAAHMHVTSVNDGPVTFLLDSARLF